MRALTPKLEEAVQSRSRRPAYKILAFDPKLDTMSKVVTGTYTQTPYDLTPYCTDITWSPTRLQFKLADPEALFHPDFGPQRKYLADKAAIRLVEGEVGLDESLWINTFTGYIQGQIGWRLERRSQTVVAQVSVYSRENNPPWKLRSITSRSYSVGTEIGVMLTDLCTDLMGLSQEELRFPPVLGLQFRHQSNQIVQMAPWDAVSSILQAVCRVPFFDGDGRLTSYSKDLSLPEARKLSDWQAIIDYEIPENNQATINRVNIIFLDSALSKVPGLCQKLGSATATAGFFMPGITIDCWWSEDRKQRAENTFMLVKQSCVTRVGRLIPITWATEDYEPIDEFHGQIKISVTIYSDLIFAFELLQYAITTLINYDDVITFGMFAETGITIPIGRLRSAIALIQILATMMCIGTGQYEVWGTPYDYCYQEQKSIAVECNLNYWEENPMDINNDFLGSYDQADAVAYTELAWQKSRGKPRKLVIRDDPALEIGDTIRLPDGQKFCIADMSKQLVRGEVPLLSLDGFKVLRA
jgi:hypothetical protein